MENLETYIAFDLEFNTVDGVSHIIQVSAIKMDQHEEVDQFDSFVYSDVPLQVLYQWFDGDYSGQDCQGTKARVRSDGF